MPSTLPREHQGTVTPTVECKETIETIPEKIPVYQRTDVESEGIPTETPAHNHRNRNSVFTLLGNLLEETRRLIRQEIMLLKSEMSEKISHLGRNVVFMAIGAGIAFVGAVVLFIGLGYLIAWLIQKAGVEGLLAAFIGIGGLGLVVVVTGGAFLAKGLAGVKAESLSPERTLQTLQELKGSPVDEKSKTPQPPPEPKRSPAEIQSRVEATEEEMGETLEALRDRLSPRNINARVKQRISVHPYRSGLIAMTAGLLSGLAIRWRFSRASA